MTDPKDDKYAGRREFVFGTIAVGVFLALGLGVLGFAEKRGEFLVVKLCFAGIALCIVVCYWLWWIGGQHTRKRKIVLGLATAAAAIAIVGLSLPWIDGKERERVPPDVTLCFVGVQHPAVWAVNLSETLIESATLLAPALFDLDSPTPDDPLQIHPQVFDLISPHSYSGGYAIFENMPNSPTLKNGDRIVGSVGIKCAKCEEGRTFLVSIIWGAGGWFSQLKDTNAAGNVLLLMNIANPNAPHTSGAAYVPKIEAVPIADRVPIRNMADLLDADHNVVPSNCAKK